MILEELLRITSKKVSPVQTATSEVVKSPLLTKTFLMFASWKGSHSPRTEVGLEKKQNIFKKTTKKAHFDDFRPKR